MTKRECPAAEAEGAGQATDLVSVDCLTVLGPNGRELAGPATFRIPAGTVTALTGPSGSGKTTVMRALLGQLPSERARATGSASVAGHDVLTLDRPALHRFRRRHIAFVGQDPGSALNPLLRVRALLREVAPDAPESTLTDTLALVGLSPDYLRRRPGELSGGQQRRVALARALIRRTGVLVLDEPLAGLHGALRTDIAGQLAALARERSVAILLSGHDTALVHSIADDIVELGVAGSASAHPARRPQSGTPRKTFGMAADSATRPSATGPIDGVRTEMRTRRGLGPDPAGGVAQTRNSHHGAAVITDDRVVLRAEGISASINGHQVLADIDFALGAGSALAVVGASGAGKTTLARVVAGLHRSASGSLEMNGNRIAVGANRRIRYGSSGIQLVTQNPRSALNPRRTVAQTLGRPLRRIGRVARRDLSRRVADLLAAVELSADLAARYPHELSGGQRQRVALARALAAEPAVLLCDEITSALDHATASAIMALLDRIRAERDTALLIITHDMALVAEYCPSLLVLDQGRIAESGHTGTVLAAPTHNATSELLV
ncbi:ABC transporter ATP-binding protein [Nocardia arthritidis]|uniref:ABC transporter ATP-binding protein n=1 Tax=Nocardia arthritidis TaxID=228602 RepID=UPI001FDF043E|nr:ATP-binding cassette domain-containing protein [Nocardia arthritidis]